MEINKKLIGWVLFEERVGFTFGEKNKREREKKEKGKKELIIIMILIIIIINSIIIIIYLNPHPSTLALPSSQSTTNHSSPLQTPTSNCCSRAAWSFINLYRSQSRSGPCPSHLPSNRSSTSESCLRSSRVGIFSRSSSLSLRLHKNGRVEAGEKFDFKLSNFKAIQVLLLLF